MKQFIGFPSIDQFRTAIKNIRSYHDYHNEPYPIRTFEGTVKIHGTNAGVGYCPATDELWCQSRENIITIEKDNAGFAWFVSQREQYFKTVLKNIHTYVSELYDNPPIIIVFGEFAGGNIQKNVAVTGLDKFFSAFDVYIANNNEDKTRIAFHNWFSNTELNIFNSTMFPTWTVDIDFANPGAVSEYLEQITNQIEQQCPVGKHFGSEGVGEGAVWLYSDAKIGTIRFKVKGEKHSVSKVKSGSGVAAISPEVLASIEEFVAYSVTPERLNQGIQRVFVEHSKEIDVKETGVFLKWLFSDIMKEEHDVLAASGLEPKQVSGAISKAGREWFHAQLAIV